MSPLAPPQKHAVYRLSVARMIAVLGAEAGFVALVATTFQRTHSATWGSIALLAAIATGGLVSPIAGTLGDRYDRRRVIVASELATAVCTAALAFATAPWLIVVFAAIGAIAQAPLMAASQAAIPNLVPEEHIVWANAVRTRANSAGFMLGPVVGGGLVAWLGTSPVFLANAMTFIISAVLTWSVRGSFNEERSERDRHGVTAGFGFIWHDRILRTILAAWFVSLLGVGALLVAEYPLAQSFHMGSIGYGLLIGFWGGGTLLGTLVAERVVIRTIYWSLVAGLGVMSIMLGAVALAPWFAMICVTQVIGGIADSHVNVAEQTIVQRRVPDELRSRVFAANEAIVLAALGLSMAAGGPLVDAFGPRAAYGLTGASGVIATVILAFGVRELRALGADEHAVAVDASVVRSDPHAAVLGTATVVDTELPTVPRTAQDNGSRIAV